MSTPLLLAVYCLFIIAASVLGGLLPILVRLTHTRLQIIISLTAGFMLGVALLHMIPHAMDNHGTAGLEPKAAMSAVLIGFLVMFFIERFFSFHTHKVAEVDDEGKVLTPAQDLPEHSPEDHAHHHGGSHAHGMAGHTPGHKLSWTGAAIGMTLHSAIAGIALGSAVASEAGGGAAGAAALAGFAVFLVIVLHKPLDSLTIITLTAAAGFKKSSRHLINGLFALAVPLGVVLFGLGLSQTTLAESGTLVGAALAFSAGTFLCISLSDLLPELHFHSHDRAKLTLALIIGVALAYAIAVAEHSMHDHDHHGHGDHAGHTGGGHHEDHSGHDHGAHAPHDDHAGHDEHEDHSGHGHEPHGDHDGHGDHEGHDHGSHDNHGGHGHESHKGHDHNDHATHEGHDHAEHGHDAHHDDHTDHRGHDHSSHENHGHDDHEGHDHGDHEKQKSGPALQDAWSDFLKP